jgi:phosphoenolpyruvate synthase/pyruvate phosphate dikinase
MMWEKLVEREGDFLKNCLLHESLESDFPREFGTNHCDFLTVRTGDTFTHYYDSAGAKKMNEILKSADMSQFVNEGKRRFEKLLKSIGSVDICEYFRLYRACYPMFNLTVFAGGLKENEMKMLAGLRLFGRKSFNRAHELANPLLSEIAGRFEISLKELKFLSPKEIIDLLDGKNIDVASAVKKREKCYFLHIDGKSVLKENEMFHAQEALQEDLKGRGTFPAFYRGDVKVVNTVEDMKKLNYGDVLVTRMTTPDMIASGLERAGAFVTDEGGITCHAAALSREFNIPAVFGTRSATKMLKDGDRVEIDTEKGTVKKV